jgi:hypothetical protein
VSKSSSNFRRWFSEFAYPELTLKQSHEIGHHDAQRASRRLEHRLSHASAECLLSASRAENFIGLDEAHFGTLD